jgi:hypothetical protein
MNEVSRGRVAGAVGDASFHGAVGGCVEGYFYDIECDCITSGVCGVRCTFFAPSSMTEIDEAGELVVDR